MSDETKSTTGSKSADAYLIEATMLLLPEAVKTQDEARLWIESNVPAIAEKASELQWALLDKLNKPGVESCVKRILSARVWGAVNRAEIARKAQAESLAALETNQP